jgi:transcriptional regulator with XRE-family HTH domain
MSNIVTLALHNYVSQKGKSLSQVAYYLEVSKGHLSEIKNEKKVPSLDLGLRILNFTKATEEQKKEWIETSTRLISKNYEELTQTESLKRKKIYIKENLGTILSENLELLQVFLDIVNTEQQGLTQNTIVAEYGENVLQDVNSLVKLNYIKVDNGCFTLDEDVRLVLDRQSSYLLMKSVFEKLKKQDLLQEKKGLFQFEMDDISKAGIMELEKIHKEAMAKAAEVYKKHNLKRSQGGERYIFQMLTAGIQNSMKVLILVIFSMLLLKSGNTWAGGVEGGSSDSSTIFSSEIETNISNFVLQNFNSKEEAYQKAMLMSDKIKQGIETDLSKKLKDQCNDPRNNTKAKLKITPLKLRVFPQYDLKSGTEKFEARIEYQTQCAGKIKL